MERHRQSTTIESKLVNEWNIKQGSEIKLVKLVDDGKSTIKSGTVLSGTLDSNIEIGKQISIDRGSANTTSIRQIDEHQGKIYVKTQTSIYELIGTNSNVPQEQIKRPKSIITARGSQYIYLEDGRTQRFKEVTKELQDPQDILVFIPPYENIRNKALQRFPHIFNEVHNTIDYLQLLLSYVHQRGKTVRPINEEGESLTSMKDLKSPTDQVFLYFYDKKDKQNSFYLPVSQDPRIGWNTFDTSLRYDDDGDIVRTRHIGNKVTDIKY